MTQATLSTIQIPAKYLAIDYIAMHHMFYV